MELCIILQVKKPTMVVGYMITFMVAASYTTSTPNTYKSSTTPISMVYRTTGKHMKVKVILLQETLKLTSSMALVC
jgi:hypothetical protein